MEKHNISNWFEIPCKNISKAMAFYEKSFDVTFSTEEMGPLKLALFPWEQKQEGSAGALVNGPSYNPSQDGTMVYFSVEDIEKTLNKVAMAGGKILNPKTSIGKYGYIAHFEDSEGNRVGLHSMK